MPYNHYDWSDVRIPPILHSHSSKKHKIIETYVEKYFEQYSGNITIIDGFAGGGIYRNTFGDICDGSPIIFLKTIDRIYCTGKRIDAFYYFVDCNSTALFTLNKQLYKNGYGNLIGKNIFLINSSFSTGYNVISEVIKNRNGKILFLLDQYGYKDVPVYTLKRIFIDFPKAEVMLTFAVGALVNYLVDTPQFYKCVGGEKSRYSILPKKDIGYLSMLKKKKSKRWRKAAENKIMCRIRKICGSLYYHTAVITSNKSNRSYWFLHISSLKKSHIQMVRVCKNLGV